MNKFDNLKVIWNITQKCEYYCSFCSTNSGGKNNEELSFEQKIKIAKELKKINNLRLDIAGGDPLYDQNDINALKYISEHIIHKFTLTTTGFAIQKYINGSISNIFDISKEYDISYDYPSKWNDNHRGKNYNNNNFKYIKFLIENNIKVHILITLSEYNTKPEVFNQMIKELEQLNLTSITLLRLMPVGRQKYTEYPTLENYDPSLAIEQFSKSFKNKVKLHCAFRAYIPNYYCNMLIEKIGIDNLGNVYACAWAGYLNINKKSNPFYLGNLLKSNIEELFNSEKYFKLKDILAKKQVNFCPIFSFLDNNKSKLFNFNKQHSVKLPKILYKYK